MQTALLDPARGNALIQARKSVPRMTQGNPEALAYADIFKFNDGDSARMAVGAKMKKPFLLGIRL